MKKFAVLIDSTVYLSEKEIKDHDISVVSLNVVESTISYREIDVDNEFIFTKQAQGKSFTTSQPSPGEFLEAFEALIGKGYEKVFCVLLSKQLSGTFQSANLAKKMLDDPQKVYVFDTNQAAYGNEMLTLELVEMIEQNIPYDDIIERMNRIIKNSRLMFTVENLFSLSKGGRLSTTQAAIGTILRIKPIIKIIDGKLELVKKERTRNNVHKYFIENIIEDSKGFEKITFRITNTYSQDSALELLDAIKEAFPKSTIVFTNYLGPVFSIHVGNKGYGISWFAE
ncbi:MAG: DegV family protein [Firmicutes bacterium]|nr:DegV family protein [Bacillota bacterium]